MGFIAVRVPQRTTVSYPGTGHGPEKRFPRDTYLRVPIGDTVIVADMRSLLPASVWTIFGIGVQLGLLTMLAGELAAVSATARDSGWGAAYAVAALMAGYAVTATIALASSRPGSALASDSRASYIR